MQSLRYAKTTRFWTLQPTCIVLPATAASAPVATVWCLAVGLGAHGSSWSLPEVGDPQYATYV